MCVVASLGLANPSESAELVVRSPNPIAEAEAIPVDLEDRSAAEDPLKRWPKYGRGVPISGPNPVPNFAKNRKTRDLRKDYYQKQRKIRDSSKRARLSETRQVSNDAKARQVHEKRKETRKARDVEESNDA